MRISCSASGVGYALRLSSVLVLALICNLLPMISTMNAAETSKSSSTNQMQLATLGGGCFWCLEALYETFDGVKAVTSGYAGGTTSNPSYEQVCTDRTGHAEVVQIEFDPAKISYQQLL